MHARELASGSAGGIEREHAHRGGGAGLFVRGDRELDVPKGGWVGVPDSAEHRAGVAVYVAELGGGGVRGE